MERIIKINSLPSLKDPILIAGFEGWGNALGVASAMISYLVRRNEAPVFAKLDPDLFYRFDEMRPTVTIEEGRLKSLSPPGGTFYVAEPEKGRRSLVLFEANEPQTRWITFVREILDLCHKLGINMLITLGSMYDNVLHTDQVISGMASSESLIKFLESHNIIAIEYQGPSAIHSTFHWEAQRRGIDSVSLWCHCPFYIQGATHFGLLARLCQVLGRLCGFQLDTQDLESGWKELKTQIQALIEKNPDLQEVVEELRRAKVRGSWATIKASSQKNGKVIHLRDFLKPTS
ncbi:MAG TPA: PAC2 family protein [Desulfobacterales bacterium]|nr:PAC2 family protein [Desulfobacterales bacterium]